MGGARVFGPKPRDYRTKLNLKTKQLARKSALTYKAQENGIIVVEDFNYETPKTKQFLELVKNLKVEGKKVLVLMPSDNKNVYLSARNLKKAEVIGAAKLNAYKTMNADVVVMCESAVKTVDEILTK